ncbi:MAG: hypothetical protein KBD29_03075 [Candidatus Magasanikbacteria bacterium]|nr:hypothetical protein [Candidatus Magasanikbacteria bacterium]
MKKYLILVIALAAYGVLARLMPHSPNFVPITALALVGGLYLPRKLAYIVPMAAMLASDLFIGFYHPLVMVSVYGCLLLTTYMGTWAKKHKNVGTIVAITFASTILFYFATNTMVWAFGALYPRTLAGLLESYTLALPFFRNSLLSDFFYTGVLVGGIEAAIYWNKQRHDAKNKIETLAS